MRVRPAGDRAVLVELPNLEAVHRLTAAARCAREEGRLPAADLVPGYRTLLVTGAEPPRLAEQVRALEPASPEQAEGREVSIDVCYDGEDLDEVARLTGRSSSEVIERHTAAEYLVAFLGFSPGFPYLLGLDPALEVPRRETPRTSVPAGSVGLAGSQTGVYPKASPGGWQLLGRTSAVLFDPERDPPALLAPGDRLRFRAVDAVDPAPEPQPLPPSSGSVLVDAAGPLTTVQDGGRVGYAHLGVPASGAADLRALRLANRLVGNEPEAAALEVTLGGLALRFESPGYLAVTGARVDVALEGRLVGTDSGVSVRAGSVVRLGSAAHGLRSYVAVRGGIDVPPVLGSRSTDTLGALGPRPLRDGDRLPVGDGRAANCGHEVTYEVVPEPEPGDELELRLMPGPRDDWLTADAMERLLHSTYTVTSSSDRTGLRLDGPELEWSQRRELPSEGMVTGAVQVPQDGKPILFLANHPTTGGYPVVGVVVADDLPLAGQARPGVRVRFRRVAPLTL